MGPACCATAKYFKYHLGLSLGRCSRVQTTLLRRPSCLANSSKSTLPGCWRTLRQTASQLSPSLNPASCSTERQSHMPHMVELPFLSWSTSCQNLCIRCCGRSLPPVGKAPETHCGLTMPWSRFAGAMKQLVNHVLKLVVLNST